jgi:3-hydroxyacyl-CoA dehydrogenase/enoyl-CoA hydratase/3-hydroxybutyryl-CoA epimerase
MYSEGVPGPVLDRAAKRFGMPMGPIAPAEVVGPAGPNYFRDITPP